MILKSLFTLACLAVYVRAQQPCLNAPAAPHSFAASPLSCAHYTICMGGNTIVGPDQQCPPGLNFDPPTESCGQTSCMECSRFGVQNLPHPDNCYEYVECIMGNRKILTCPVGLLFDRSVGQCNHAHVVHCPGDEVTDDPLYPTTNPWDPTTHPYDTTSDYMDTTPWDTTPWVPPTTPTPSPSLPICTGGQVYHAHPSDCRRYFLCLNFVLWHRECPADLHWNQIVNVCDFPENAGCIHHGGGGTTTIDPPLFPPPEEPWTEPSLLPPNPNQN